MPQPSSAILITTHAAGARPAAGSGLPLFKRNRLTSMLYRSSSERDCAAFVRHSLSGIQNKIPQNLLYLLPVCRNGDLPGNKLADG